MKGGLNFKAFTESCGVIDLGLMPSHGVLHNIHNKPKSEESQLALNYKTRRSLPQPEFIPET